MFLFDEFRLLAKVSYDVWRTSFHFSLPVALANAR